jgi:hypothetical protein
MVAGGRCVGEAAVSLALSLARSLARSHTHSPSLDGRYGGTDVVASRRGLFFVFFFHVRTTSHWSDKVQNIKVFGLYLKKSRNSQHLFFFYLSLLKS